MDDINEKLERLTTVDTLPIDEQIISDVKSLNPIDIEVTIKDTLSDIKSKKGDSNISSDIPSNSKSSENLKTEIQSNAKSEKVTILLKSAGGAPILKQQKWVLQRSKTIGWLIKFIHRCLKREVHDSIFIYVNQSFSPSLDTPIGTLFECFGTKKTLTLHYCMTAAWG